MIETLDKLTVSQFVDLVCGDTSVLLKKGEKVTKERIEQVTRDIIYQYREIADSNEAKSFLADSEDMVKARILCSILSICNNLVAMKKFELVKDILEECDINAGAMSNERIEAEVYSRLERARLELEKLRNRDDNARKGSEDPRKDFDAQTAALMAYFKFQIDPSTMKATLYAHLIDRFNREIKAQKSQLEQLKRK